MILGRKLRKRFGRLPNGLLLTAILLFVLSVSACGQTEPAAAGDGDAAGDGQTEAVAPIDESEAAAALREQLLAEGEAAVEVAEDVEIGAPLVVNGSKTLMGSGTITPAGPIDAMLTLSEGSSLTVDGVTVNCAFKAGVGVFVEYDCLFTLSSGSINNAAASGIESYGDVTVTGGSVNTPGESWIYMQRAGVLTVSDGYFGAAGRTGVHIARNTKAYISGGTFEAAGGYAIFNRGELEMTGGLITKTADRFGICNAHLLTIDGPVEISYSYNSGLILNLRDGVANISGAYLHHGGTYAISNSGVAHVADTRFDNCSSSIIANGTVAELYITNCSVTNGWSHGIFNRGLLVGSGLTFDNIANKAVSNTGGYATLTDITVTNCKNIPIYNTNREVGVYEYGDISVIGFSISGCLDAGVASYGGNLVLEDGTISTVKSNIYVRGGTASITDVQMLGTSDGISACLVVGSADYRTANVTLDGILATGGARGINNFATVVFNSGRITGNVQGEGMMFGGGVSNSGTFIMNGGSISGNTANKAGGGIYSSGTLTVNDGEITGNRARRGAGGGICIDGGRAVISSCVISGNRSYSTGAGIYNAGRLTLNGCSVRSNRSDNGSGGGVANFGRLTVSGGTIAKNAAANYGGAIYNDGKAVIKGATIKGNSAGDTGGGLVNRNTMYVADCSFAGNTGSLAVCDYDIYSNIGAGAGRTASLTLAGEINAADIYRGITTTLTLDASVDTPSPITLWLSSSATSIYYSPGRLMLSGKASLVAADYTSFKLPDGVTSVALGPDGRLHYPDGRPDPAASGSVTLLHDGNTVASGDIAAMLALAEAGDTIVITEDISLGETLAIEKDIIITDDGAPNTRTGSAWSIWRRISSPWAAL